MYLCAQLESLKVAVGSKWCVSLGALFDRMCSEELLPLGNEAGVRVTAAGAQCGTSATAEALLASDRCFFRSRARALASLGVPAASSNELFEPFGTALELGGSNAKL